MSSGPTNFSRENVFQDSSRRHSVQAKSEEDASAFENHDSKKEMKMFVSVEIDKVRAETQTSLEKMEERLMRAISSINGPKHEYREPKPEISDDSSQDNDDNNRFRDHPPLSSTSGGYRNQEGPRDGYRSNYNSYLRTGPPMFADLKGYEGPEFAIDKDDGEHTIDDWIRAFNTWYSGRVGDHEEENRNGNPMMFRLLQLAIRKHPSASQWFATRRRGYPFELPESFLDAFSEAFMDTK
ncbi:hypothetical protein BGZ76_007090, partial [Entomortierella beljakovae]